jgi:transporter family protein
MTPSSGWIFWATLSAGFAALTAVFAKVGVHDVDPDLAMAVRTLVVASLLVPLVVFAGKWSNPLALPGETLGFLALSALATGASWLCYFRALQLGDASMVVAVDRFSVVLVAAFAFLFLGERPSVREWSGIGLVTAGLLLLVLKR